MKRALQGIFILSLVFASCALCLAVKHIEPATPAIYQELKGNANITEAMVNGKPAFFKTYQDFINGAGMAGVYLYNDIVYSKGEIKTSNLVFKDESGKKIKVPATDLWGFRDEYGEVYRMGDFVFQGLTKIPFHLKYVANDHILYYPKSTSTFTVDPPIWCSENLNSAIIGKDDYFKSHSKDSYERIRLSEKDCQKKIPTKANFSTNIKALSDYNQQISECRLGVKDLICIWTITSWNKMRTDGFGSYFFSKRETK